MPTEIKLPELGENLDKGDVVDVKVAPGDTVSEGQTLLEVEAEKSTVEVPSPVGGRLSQVLVKKGDTIRVGQPLFVIEDGAGSAAPEATRPREPEASTKRQDPEARHGASEEEEETKPLVEETVPTVRVKEEPPTGNGRQTPTKVAPPAAAEPHPKTPRSTVAAGPATRRLARELGVDLSHVAGSGPRGRVTPDDVRGYVRGLASGRAEPVSAPAAPPLPDFARWGPVERQSHDPTRRKTAEHTSLAWSLVPHVTQNDQADITDLDAFRRQQEGNGPKVTVTAFVLKAAASALKQFPRFNSSLDAAKNELVLKHYYHVGVAVDTEQGLLVPVLRDVDRKSVLELAQELAALAERARQRKVSRDEMRGGTFTITNLGGIGGTGFSPIVNYPEVAILGLSRARLSPSVHNGEIVPRLILPLSLSYDHRVIDGADAARFTVRIREMLENPLQMLL